MQAGQTSSILWILHFGIQREPRFGSLAVFSSICSSIRSSPGLRSQLLPGWPSIAEFRLIFRLLPLPPSPRNSREFLRSPPVSFSFFPRTPRKFKIRTPSTFPQLDRVTIRGARLPSFRSMRERPPRHPHPLLSYRVGSQRPPCQETLLYNRLLRRLECQIALDLASARFAERFEDRAPAGDLIDCFSALVANQLCRFHVLNVPKLLEFVKSTKVLPRRRRALRGASVYRALQGFLRTYQDKANSGCRRIQSRFFIVSSSTEDGKKHRPESRESCVESEALAPDRATALHADR
jgi:hypothetical protein